MHMLGLQAKNMEDLTGSDLMRPFECHTTFVQYPVLYSYLPRSYGTVLAPR